MRISLIVQGRFHAFDLAREFHRKGHLHQLITPYPHYIVKRFGVPTNKVTSLIAFEIVRRVLDRFPLDVRIRDKFELRWLELYARAAARVLKECDVLIAWSSIASPAFIKARNWDTICICERGSSHILTQERLLREEYLLQGIPWIEWSERKRKLELNDYQQADFIEVPSNFAKTSMIDHGIPDNRIICSPYGVNIEQFHVTAKAVHDKFRVIFAGSLSLQKGIHYLEQGFAEANLPNSELWFVGKSTHETRALLKCEDSRIHLIGHVPQNQLPRIYQQADVFVLPSIQEGLAMVQVQALASGLALICTTNTGGEDLLRLSGNDPIKLENGVLQYPAGFVVPIRRPDCIAYCLQSLHENQSLRESMSREAINISANRMDWSNTANSLINKYMTL